MKVKSLDAISSKWSTRAAAAGPAYQAGVQNPKTSWATATTQAANSWASGVQTAVTNGSFTKGVNKTGDAGWQAGATGKGVQRYPQGVQGAAPNYSAGFSPYLTVLSNLTLPARMPKGDPSNNARAQAVATALRNAKVGKAS